MSHKIITAVKLKVKRQIIFSSKFYFHISSKKNQISKSHFWKCFFFCLSDQFFSPFESLVQVGFDSVKKIYFHFFPTIACLLLLARLARERESERKSVRERERKKERVGKKERGLKNSINPRCSYSSLTHVLARACMGAVCSSGQSLAPRTA